VIDTDVSGLNLSLLDIDLVIMIFSIKQTSIKICSGFEM